MEQSGEDVQMELQGIRERLSRSERSEAQWKSRALAADIIAQKHEAEIESLKHQLAVIVKSLDKGEESSGGGKDREHGC